MTFTFRHRFAPLARAGAVLSRVHGSSADGLENVKVLVQQVKMGVIYSEIRN